MKNWMKGLAVGVLALGLAACNDTAEPKKDPETGKPEQVENKSEMTAQEVYKKSMEVSDEQKSMHAKMDIEQSIKMPSEELDMNSNIKMDLDMVIDPMEMYQKMTMDMGEQGSMDIEMYMAEAGFFMHDPDSGQWLKFPDEMYADMIGEMGAGADPTLDMEMFKDFMEDFKFEQTDNEYILTLAASGEKFTKLFKDIAAENMPAGLEMSEEEAELMENMEVKALNFEIFIDKETFYTNAFNMDMDMTMTVEGQEMNIVQKINADISKINEIEKIEIPQEVLDSAIDINEAMGGMEEVPEVQE
jgi:hypothetical protein